ncbi:MAG: hypothetical protein QP801_05515, partial [Staphylococcus warneri]
YQFLFVGALALPALLAGFLFENLNEGSLAQLALLVEIGFTNSSLLGPLPFLHCLQVFFSKTSMKGPLPNLHCLLKLDLPIPLCWGPCPSCIACRFSFRKPL